MIGRIRSGRCPDQTLISWTISGGFLIGIANSTQHRLGASTPSSSVSFLWEVASIRRAIIYKDGPHAMM